ncbi:transposase [Halomonas sp. BM-2019]|uniref:transposase n=1 Tax=Halomonas sp. BM-2019 TaxID=2811227 RepID=UPI0031FE0CF3
MKLDPWYPSSKTCFHCGHRVESMPPTVRTWDCPACGTQGIDRDINAARNVRFCPRRPASIRHIAGSGLRSGKLRPLERRAVT